MLQPRFRVPVNSILAHPAEELRRRSGDAWHPLDRDARRAVEGADDDYDHLFSADDACPLCGGAGYLEHDDEALPRREPCPDCGGRP